MTVTTSPIVRPRPHRRPALLAVGVGALLLPGLLAGCSSTPTDEGGTGSATRAAGSSASAQLGQCLRDAGFEVDDPDYEPGGAVMVPPGPDGEAYADQFETCREQLPESETGGSRTTTDTAGLQEARLEVAQCMRDAGFDDFPDPVDGVFRDGLSLNSENGMAEALGRCDAEFGPGAAGAR
jgi:hypothetical protein